MHNLTHVSLFCSHGLYCLCQPSPVQSTEGKTLHPQPPSQPPLMCHRWLCRYIPVPVLTLSNHHKQFDEKSIITRAICCHCIPKCVALSLSSSFLLLSLFGSPVPPLPISASRSPLLPSLSPHSLVSGWKVQWGCGIPEGQGVCLSPEHSMWANQGILISQSNLSAVEGDCVVVVWMESLERRPKCVPISYIYLEKKSLNLR